MVQSYVSLAIHNSLKIIILSNFQRVISDPEGIRTPDPQLRRLLLYPAELPDPTLSLAVQTTKKARQR